MFKLNNNPSYHCFIAPPSQIAQKLKQIGDEIDEKVRKQLEDAFTDEIKKGVFQIGREQFSRMCRSVLYKCSESLQNGWQQASVVYMGMDLCVVWHYRLYIKLYVEYYYNISCLCPQANVVGN